MQLLIVSDHKIFVAIFPLRKHVYSQVAQLHRMEEELQVCFKTFEIPILGGDDCSEGDQTTTGHL